MMRQIASELIRITELWLSVTFRASALSFSSSM